ncbi:MAG: asparagine synthase-related protein [Agathobacter sp.]|nr:asparagine synthase-related protein [Agathobacter sp.]
MVDIDYCASSYLMYRYVFNKEKSFIEGENCNLVDLAFDRKKVRTSDDLIAVLDEMVKEATKDGKAALALSGGIDSAILAKFMPKGATAYTFRCIVPGREVTDESQQAAYWADICGLNHEIIDITWEDIVSVIDELLLHKRGPVHSIEAQIYIAAKKVKGSGKERFILGENADIIYGGMNGLLEKDWLLGEFVDRYTYCMPYKVLKNPVMILEPFKEFEEDGHIDGHDFINKYFRQEALGTYTNACETAGVEFVGPYSKTVLDAPVDYTRIRSGDTKYIIREAFRKLYPGVEMPQKIPMPRPVNEWFAKWEGPVRDEFIPHCTDNMTGDQKWMVWCLERFLNLIGGE